MLARFVFLSCLCAAVALAGVPAPTAGQNAAWSNVKDYSFTMFCAHKGTTVAQPGMLNCGNLGGMRFYLDKGKAAATSVTEFRVSLKGVKENAPKMMIVPAHIFVDTSVGYTTSGYATKRHQQTSLDPVRSERIDVLDRMGLHVFDTFKFGTKQQYDRLYKYRLRPSKVMAWIEDCQKADIKCFFTLPFVDASLNYGTEGYVFQKVQTGSVANFMSIPRMPSPTWINKNPYDMTDAELDEVRPTFTTTNYNATGQLPATNQFHNPLNPNFQPYNPNNANFNPLLANPYANLAPNDPRSPYYNPNNPNQPLYNNPSAQSAVANAALYAQSPYNPQSPYYNPNLAPMQYNPNLPLSATNFPQQYNPYQANPYQANPYQANPYQSNPYNPYQSTPYNPNVLQPQAQPLYSSQSGQSTPRPNSVITETSTGAVYCGEIAYSPATQICCPGNIVVSSGTRCP